MYIYIYLAQTITTSSHGLVTFEMVVNSKVNPLQNPPKQLKLRDFFSDNLPRYVHQGTNPHESWLFVF